MRTTKQLIEELHTKADGAFLAAIVVGFEQNTEFVLANAADPLSDLNTLVESGGEPVAVCRVNKGEGTMSYSLQPLAEYADEGWVHRYLDALGTKFVSLLAARAGVKVGEIQRVRPDLN